MRITSKACQNALSPCCVYRSLPSNCVASFDWPTKQSGCRRCDSWTTTNVCTARGHLTTTINCMTTESSDAGRATVERYRGCCFHDWVCCMQHGWCCDLLLWIAIFAWMVFSVTNNGDWRTWAWLSLLRLLFTRSLSSISYPVLWLSSVLYLVPSVLRSTLLAWRASPSEVLFWFSK